MTDDADGLSERLLVLRCQVGEEAAFAALVEKYQPRLRYYLRKLLTGVGEPEDVLQDIWLDVYRSIARLKDVAAFRAWLYSIARGRAIKRFRSRRLAFQPLKEDVPDDKPHDRDLFKQEDVQRVHAALDTLPAVQREALVLRYIEDMRYEEIALVMNCTVGMVRSRLHYAKLALRKEAEKDYSL
jgi:RNA polymerase sigma-70 factor (ECF subfamily)